MVAAKEEGQIVQQIRWNQGARPQHRGGLHICLHVAFCSYASAHKPATTHGTAQADETNSLGTWEPGFRDGPDKFRGSAHNFFISLGYRTSKRERGHIYRERDPPIHKSQP